jgi:hypothetical protein
MFICKGWQRGYKRRLAKLELSDARAASPSAIVVTASMPFLLHVKIFIHILNWRNLPVFDREERVSRLATYLKLVCSCLNELIYDERTGLACYSTQSKRNRKMIHVIRVLHAKQEVLGRTNVAYFPSNVSINMVRPNTNISK